MKDPTTSDEAPCWAEPVQPPILDEAADETTEAIFLCPTVAASWVPILEMTH